MAASSASLGARFTRKLGPLPVWAWAALIVGAYLAYSHFHGQTASGATTADTGQPSLAAGGVDTGAGAGSAGGSAGLGNPADNFAQDQFAALGASIGALASQQASLSAALSAQQVPPDGGGTSAGVPVYYSPGYSSSVQAQTAQDPIFYSQAATAATPYQAQPVGTSTFSTPTPGGYYSVPAAGYAAPAAADAFGQGALVAKISTPEAQAQIAKANQTYAVTSQAPTSNLTPVQPAQQVKQKPAGTSFKAS